MLYMEPSTLPRAVAEVVRIALEEADISHREVTRLTGIPTATLSRRMTGNSPFVLDEIEQICTLLKIKPSELMLRAEALMRGEAVAA